MVSGEIRRRVGRAKESGKFGEPTKASRVPSKDIEQISRLIHCQFYRLPFYQSCVSAGFPSPAEDELEDRLDLNELLVKHPSATFFLRVSGNSMVKAGIHHNDILIVDRSIEPSNGKIVIASLDGELTVKRLQISEKKASLLAENDFYQPIEITREMDFRIWGVVTNVIHAV